MHSYAKASNKKDWMYIIKISIQHPLIYLLKEGLDNISVI